jgi:hypothetical protein
MRECREHERSIGKRNVIRSGEDDGVAVWQTEAFTALFVGSREGELERRMTGDERAQFAPRVPTRAEYADWNPMHAECILLHESYVNAYIGGPTHELRSPIAHRPA